MRELSLFSSNLGVIRNGRLRISTRTPVRFLLCLLSREFCGYEKSSTAHNFLSRRDMIIFVLVSLAIIVSLLCVSYIKRNEKKNRSRRRKLVRFKVHNSVFRPESVVRKRHPVSRIACIRFLGFVVGRSLEQQQCAAPLQRRGHGKGTGTSPSPYHRKHYRVSNRTLVYFSTYFKQFQTFTDIVIMSMNTYLRRLYNLTHFFFLHTKYDVDVLEI